MGSRDCYLLELMPKRRDKYLFIGKAWIDKEDLGIARMEGEPVRSPSFWVFVRRSCAISTVARVLAAIQDETRTEIRFAGDTSFEFNMPTTTSLRN